MQKPVLTLESCIRWPLKGDYDTNGRYFGAGRPVYCMRFDDGQEWFYRAYDREGAARAMMHALKSLPDKLQTLTVNGVDYPARDNPLPWQQKGLSETASYGRRLTTTREVYYGGRWRRVYCCCFSNSGTQYLGKSLSEGLIVRD